jgi:uncharacterized repeat protein (TIGR01451 family)
VGGLHERVTPSAETIQSSAARVKQDLAAEGHIGTDVRHELFESTPGLLVDDVDVPWEAGRRMLPFESRDSVHSEQFDLDQTALTERKVTGAVQWDSIQSVELVIDGRPALMATATKSPSALVVFEPPTGDSRLQLFKHATPEAAEPGATVEITIRFRNAGPVPISNLKIIDSLSTRLEYVDGWEQCSLRALFSAKDNIAGSAKLKWEIREQLQPGDSGEIRFGCLVR